MKKLLGFCIHELIYVVIVCKDKEFVFAAFQVVVLSLKCLNNGQELLIVSLVQSFCKNHFSKKKGYWVLLTNFSWWIGKIRLIIRFISHLIYKTYFRSQLT